MTFDRRTFLLGTGSGLSLLVLSACTTPTPVPGPTTSAPTTPVAGVPEPSAFVRSNWSKDQFARGAVSFQKVGSTPEHRSDLAEPIGNRVFFAGEATSVDNPGTVMGARQSGRDAAAALAALALTGDKVAVIGAGAAGAEAAKLLAVYGYDVTVIEAREQVGGRISTIATDDWPVPVSLGAWLLRDSSDSELASDLRSAGVASSLLSSVEYRNDEGATDDTAPVTGSDAVAKAVAWAASQLVDVPLDTSLESSGANADAAGTTVNDLAGAEILAQYLAGIAMGTGAASVDLSSWYGVDPTAAEDKRAVTGDYSALITDALGDIKPFLTTTVTGIAYDDDSVSLRFGTGESLTVDRVVVTVPLGVLQADAIEFTPLLPFAHRTAISALGMGTVDAVWLSFDEPFWSTDATVWNLIGTDDDITTWFNLEPITGDAVLVGLVGGDAALRLAEYSDDEVRAAAMVALAPFAG
jgi:monoamine oxidase